MNNKLKLIIKLLKDILYHQVIILLANNTENLEI